MSELTIHDFEHQMFSIQLNHKRIENGSIYENYGAQIKESNDRGFNAEYIDSNDVFKFKNKFNYFVEKVLRAVGKGGMGIFYTFKQKESNDEYSFTTHTFRIAKLAPGSFEGIGCLGCASVENGSFIKELPTRESDRVFGLISKLEMTDEQTILNRLDKRFLLSQIFDEKRANIEREELDKIKSQFDRANHYASYYRRRAVMVEKIAGEIHEKYLQQLSKVHNENLKNFPTK